MSINHEHRHFHKKTVLRSQKIQSTSHVALNCLERKLFFPKVHISIILTKVKTDRLLIDIIINAALN